MEQLLRHTPEAYAFGYFGVIIVVSMLEWTFPRRDPAGTMSVRWLGNFGITILDTILIRSVFPLLGVAWATLCSARGWGLFNNWTVPAWFQFLLTIVVLDGVAYAQHQLLHHVPLLWRLHRTHHTDHDYDFTTGARFHPFETVFTTVGHMFAIVVLGAPPIAVLVSELLTIAITFIEHANVRVPASLDKLVRLILVTPEMHRIHHSRDVREGQSNLGTTFSWWDRLFSTYMDRPEAGHNDLTFGVTGFLDRKHLTLPWMLAQPFLRAGRDEPNPIGVEGQAAFPIWTPPSRADD
jgi:sterol desaturase/sphingolipid hydroxylase (fatty acid hydroxylase superfamily)